MKTSFYFLLWILIYPILGLLGNNFVDTNSFIFAIVIVWGLSMLINKMMPHILAYEHVSERASILEDIYTDNIAKFKRRLDSDKVLETISGCYFIVALVAIGWTVLQNGLDSIIALVVFALFTYGAIVRSIQLIKASSRLNANPTKEECVEVAREVYHLDYQAYYAQRSTTSFSAMLPPRPKRFGLFKVASIVIAAIAGLLGVVVLIYGVLSLMDSYTGIGGIYGMMLLLYGSLATYYGIKDLATLLVATKKRL